MSPKPTSGFIVEIRCNAVVAKRVQLWASRGTTDDPHISGGIAGGGNEFDLTGYTALFCSVRQHLEDAAVLMTVNATVSLFDADGAPVTPDFGWVELYAPVSETDNAQDITEIASGHRIRGFIDIIGYDGGGSLQALAFGYADLLPGVTP